MSVIQDANLEYEAEIKRNPDSLQLWMNYLDESKSSSQEVCNSLGHFWNLL